MSLLLNSDVKAGLDQLRQQRDQAPTHEAWERLNAQVKAAETELAHREAAAQRGQNRQCRTGRGR